MSDAIGIRGLSKRYLISHQRREHYTMLRDVLGHKARALFERLRHPLSPNREELEIEEFWALRDIDLRIGHGERVGIIGRNGAGKSTLLKILSRITEPTTGEIDIDGRVASLLEVGTGFHPELTGRENVFLNGAVLGMTRATIRRRFDEIVAFAEVEKFLDTPVKRYSSGMYVRLAFAVAAHLEPEILIIDEVLAVGDANFQKKCLGKLEDVGRSGRTVLFVSHSMTAVSSLCDRVIRLDEGRKRFDGPTAAGILEYHADPDRSPTRLLATATNRIGDGQVRMIEAAVVRRDGSPADQVDLYEDVLVTMDYEVIEVAAGGIPLPNFHFRTADGTVAFVTQPQRMAATRSGRLRASCIVPGSLLNDGVYTVDVAVTTYAGGAFVVNFVERNALSFNVRDPMHGGARDFGYLGRIPGVVRPTLEWTVEQH